MSTVKERTEWHGVEAWGIENERLRAVTTPAVGGKLVSLYDKRLQIEWLAGPGPRAFRPIPYGAAYHTQDLSGWDEMFPTIVACQYPGPGPQHAVPLPDHGEVWTLPWRVEETDADVVTVSVLGQALPYRLTRAMRFCGPATLQLDYTLVNLSQADTPYIWAAHPQFACGAEAEVRFPPQVTRICNTLPADWGWDAPETVFDWPEAVVDGRRVRIDQVGPPTLGRGRKFFALPDARVGWARLVRRPSGDWLQLDWDPTSIPYLGLWVDEGALNHESVAAPEPTTGFYDSLAIAWDKHEVTTVAAGATVTWSLVVHVGGSDEQP